MGSRLASDDSSGETLKGGGGWRDTKNFSMLA